eukprot:sb/3467121/
MRTLFLLPLLFAISSPSLVDEYLAAVRRFSKDDGMALRTTNPKALKEHFLAFKDYKQTVDEINSDSTLPFTAAINEFSIMTEAERTLHLGVNISNDAPWDLEAEESPTILTNSDTSLPSYVNWISRGAQVPIKNQKTCGSCWAFAAVSAIEGGYYLTTGDLVGFSDQEILDCTYEKDGLRLRDGCRGGWVSTVLQYVKASGRLASDKQAPYVAKDRSCKYENKGNSLTKAKLTGYKRISFRDDAALLQNLAKGIVAVAVDVTKSFFAYKKGLYSDIAACEKKKHANHAVTVVGYGQKEGHPYWRVSYNF